MNQKFNLKIDAPCSKKFNTFTPTKAGGFCNSCQREVIDFKHMTDNEIINYFKNQKGKTCGHFNSLQLKTYSEKLNSEKNSNFSLISGIGLTLATLFATNTAQAQEEEKKQPTVIIDKTSDNTKEIKPAIYRDKIIVKGTLYDEEGLPMPDVNIYLKNSDIGTETDFDGNFEFPIALNIGDTLVTSFVGYKSKEIIVLKRKKPFETKLEIDLESFVVGEVIIDKVHKSKRSLFQKLTALFK